MKNTTHWFPRKKSGWGWGLPIAWQGWLIFGIYLVAMFILPFFISPAEELGKYLLAISGFLFILLGFCFWKGESPSRP